MRRWNVTSFVPVAAQTLQVSHSPNKLTISVDASDLGNTTAFGFYLLTAQVTGSGLVSTDDAPDGGSALWVYDPAGATTTATTTTTTTTSALPQTISLGAALAKAPGVHAGKAFTVMARVTTSAAAVRVACSARIGSRALRPTGRYSTATRTASCAGGVPKGTAGKRLTGTLTATIRGGGTRSRPFAFTIRP